MIRQGTKLTLKRDWGGGKSPKDELWTPRGMNNSWFAKGHECVVTDETAPMPMNDAKFLVAFTRNEDRRIAFGKWFSQAQTDELFTVVEEVAHE